MIDFARITVSAGDGGNGAGSFHKIKGKRYGKADGGDGGDGGNVFFEASSDLNGLDSFRYVKNYQAQRGQNGLSRRRRGAVGEDLVLRVPVGTEVKVHSAQWNPSTTLRARVDSQKKEEQSSLSTNHYSLITDLVTDGDKVLVARAGQGGRGNLKLRDEFGRRPREAERGEAGESVDVTLELKLIADVGLIGLPNAGKPTFWAKVPRATPEIANYPFTTLEPNLGVLDLSKLQDKKINHKMQVKKRLILADIPGLIEGASEGRGLGDLFLRHIERTGILVHMIDVSTVSDKWEDYQTIRNELSIYSRDLSKKLEIIALTKTDITDKKYVSDVESVFKNKRKKVFRVSNQTGEGVNDLMMQIISKT